MQFYHMRYTLDTLQRAVWQRSAEFNRLRPIFSSAKRITDSLNPLWLEMPPKLFRDVFKTNQDIVPLENEWPMVVSARFQRLVEQACPPDHVQWLPIIVTSDKGDAIRDGFYAMHVTKSFSILDIDKCKYEDATENEDNEPPLLFLIDKLVFKDHFDVPPPNLFAEPSLYYSKVVTDDLKSEVEKAGLNIFFWRVDDLTHGLDEI